MTMHGEGRQISEIRRVIDETYPAFGQGTDTPLPPSGL
jgi:hypothetical protein